MGKVAKENTSNCCVIWDGNYPVSIFKMPIKPIYSQSDLENCNLAEFKIIFILAELKWPGFIRTNFYGFKLGSVLRKNKQIQCPIIFCSFLFSFDKVQYPDSKILDYPGHYLMQLPNEPSSFDNYKSIELDTLEDIIISLFDPNQYIHDLMHNTENRCPELVYSIDKKEGKYDRMKIKKMVNDYLFSQLEIFRIEILKRNILADKASEFDTLRTKLIKEIDCVIDKDEFDPEELRSPLNTIKDQFYSFLPCDESDKIDIKVTPKRWQVLFVDDLPSSCDVIQNHFKRNGIFCHTAQTAEDAFAILRKDEEGAGKIAVVITDFRFYMDGDDKEKWQELQGYQILKQIHSHQKFKLHYAYVMLTSKKGTIQQHIKKQSKFPILWFNKTDVLAGKQHSFDIFCQRIIEVGSEAFFRKQNIPSTAVWETGQSGRIEPGYKYYYKRHIESFDYEDYENSINLSAIENIIHVHDKNELRDSFKFEISLIYNQKEGKYGSVDNFSKLLEKFRSNILTIRRIFWGLKVLLGKSSDEIFELFKKNYIETSHSKNKNSKSSEKKPKILKTSILTTYLGISKKEEVSDDTKNFIRLGLLKDEVDFLRMYSKTFEQEKSQIIKNNDDIYILQSFFSCIEHLTEIPAISKISIKLDENISISYNELEKCLKLIKKSIDSDETFNKRFKDASQFFYTNEVNDLSNDIKNRLLYLKS